MAIGIGIAGLTLSLLGDVGTRLLKHQADTILLYRQPLQTAEISLSVTFDSREKGDTVNHPTNYVTFFKGREVMLIASSPMTQSGPSAEGNITFRATLEMDEGSGALGKPLHVLRDVDRVEIAVNQMPRSGRVVDGKLICALNNSVLTEISIPSEQITPGGLIIFDMPSEAFADFAG